MLKKKTIFLTGATGNMGSCGLKELMKEPSKIPGRISVDYTTIDFTTEAIQP